MSGLCWLRLDRAKSCMSRIWPESDYKAISPSLPKQLSWHLSLVTSDCISHIQRFQCVPQRSWSLPNLPNLSMSRRCRAGMGTCLVFDVWCFWESQDALPSWWSLVLYMAIFNDFQRAGFLMQFRIVTGSMDLHLLSSSKVVTLSFFLWPSPFERVSPRLAFLAMMLCLLVSACQQLWLGQTWTVTASGSGFAFHGHLSTDINGLQTSKSSSCVQLELRQSACLHTDTDTHTHTHQSPVYSTER